MIKYKALLVFILAIVLLLPGCSTISNGASLSETPTSVPPGTFDIGLSFPEGAPALGDTRPLECTVQFKSPDVRDIELRIDLPENLEIIEGAPVWTGTIASGKETNPVRLMVKSVAPGVSGVSLDYEDSYLDERGYNATTAFTREYALTVAEDSAEFESVPAYDAPPKSPVPLP